MSEIRMIGNLQPLKPHQSQAVYSPYGISPTLCAFTHGYAEGYILETINVTDLHNEKYGVAGGTLSGIRKADGYRNDAYGTRLQRMAEHRIQRNHRGYSCQREREREMPDSERTRTTVKAKGMVTEGYPIIEKVTDEAAPILARDYKGAANIVYQNTVVECDRIDCLGQMDNSDGSYESANRVYGAEGIAPTIPTASGGGHIPKVMEVLPEERCVRKIPQEVIDKWTFEIDGQKYLIRVRKLTPRECLRLMDFDEDMIDRAVEVNSNSQLYKQAGNSICVGVLYHAYKQLFDLKEEKTEMIKPTDVNSEALAVYGIENQTRQFAEEFSELFVELNKVLRNRPDADLANVAEEIADVRIMLEQLTQYYNLDADVQIWLEAKYNRLARKLGFEEDITI